MAVYFGGSRHLLKISSHLQAVVQAVQASGQVVHVGCCSGADQQVIQAASARPSFLVVFAVFNLLGAGAVSSSAVEAVHQASFAGVPVRWLAGGPLSIPPAARLILRSQAALAGCSAAVFFWPGRGSLAVASLAVAAVQPVFAFGPIPAAIPGQLGQWVAGEFLGFSCWLWHPAAVQQSFV